MPDPIQPPTPPSRAALAAVLVQAAEAEPLLADRPALDVGWGLQRIDLANGWSLHIWWHHGQMGPLHGALPPMAAAGPGAVTAGRIGWPGLMRWCSIPSSTSSPPSSASSCASAC
jgi:hypothetical protein